mmetsp:Transcript_7707/g.22580  ORF Transcript_7707/g.22580 Transcript_7707/m.22580 type:complete len:280 (+) Transcript_7707:680-1519(+)
MPNRVAALVALTAAALLQTRPPAHSFRAEVDYLRQAKRELAAGRRPTPRKSNEEVDEMGGIGAVHRWPDGSWAADAALVSVGCTRKGCLLGVFGHWWRLATWPAEWDLGAIGAVHTYAALCGSDVYYRHFAPRARLPHTLLLGAFATRSVFELLWVGSTLYALGRPLQAALGRVGFAALYVGAGVAASLVCMLARRSSSGHGGLLGVCAYHALLLPRARQSIMGIEMGSKPALAAQIAIASQGAFQGDRPLPILAANLAPCLVAAAAFAAHDRRSFLTS